MDKATGDAPKIKWLGVREAAKRLGVSQTTLRLWLQQGRLPWRQFDYHRRIWIDERKLVAFQETAKALEESIATDEAAVILQCDAKHVRRLVDLGLLPTLQAGLSDHRFRIEDVKALRDRSMHGQGVNR